MNSPHDPQDDDLRECLRELGREDERCAPGFQRVWRAAHRAPAAGAEKAWPWAAKWALAGAMAAVCVAAVITMHHPPRAEHTETRPDVNVPAGAAPRDISDSFDPAAPTDFLLTVAGQSRAPTVEQLTSEINALLNP